MGNAKDAAQVAVDTSLIRYFSDAGHLPELIAHLPQAVAVEDVLTELTLQARSRQTLADVLQAHAGWPAELPAHLSSEDRRRVQRIQAEWIQEDRINGKPTHAESHIGEIVMVFAAAEAKVPLVVIDDRRGRRLAHSRKLETKSSIGMAVEMTALSAVPSDTGYAVYAGAASPNRAEFDRLVSEYRV